MAEDLETRYKQFIAPHFEAAYNLARWLTQGEADASDVLQEAALKAYRHLDEMTSENPRAWFFQIIRNTSYTLLKRKKAFQEIDDEIDLKDPSLGADEQLIQEATARELHECLSEIDVGYREILILREIEEMSYDDIAQILKIPIGTVMSRLARARALLKKKLLAKGNRP